MTCCKKCRLLNALMNESLSNRGYWLVTELFMELHNGKDWCQND